MTSEDAQGSDAVSDADWARIPDYDQAWAAPTNFPPPLTHPAPALLNTHEMGWEAFERLVLILARDLDGAYDVRRYGPPGQAQHGLDVVGFFDGQAPTVYQAKHWQTFRAGDLKAAVELYTGGRQPFSAGRIVIAVASEASHTATVEMLAKLRAEHASKQIELWDRGWISERLRNQSHLVARFFGSATADTFCGTVAPAPTTPNSIVADAILRGPVAHLGLSDELSRAEEALVERPSEAATILENVARRLEASGFIPHAAPVRSRQATALGASGRRAEEAWLRIDLGWRHLLAGDPFSAGIQVHEIAKWGDDAPEDIMRVTNALAAATGVRRDYSVTLDQLAEEVDLLTEVDPHRIDAALLLAEEAVASRRPDLVAPRADLFLALASKLPRNQQGFLVAARLRMCVADCSGGWEDLLGTARGTYPSPVTALIVARYARQLALIPQAQSSIARWREAIERACIEELNDDAADWLYSLRAVRLQSGLIDDDINDLHRHALALRAAGKGTLLPESFRARERALTSLRDKEWPNALEALRRYLWRATTGADLAGEMEAHELLGDLFTETGRRNEAIRHYVIAAKGDKLKTLAAALPDESLRVPIDLLSPRPWERAAALYFAAACADLMVDEDAREWCTAAFREIVENPHPAATFALSPSRAAFRAFGQLAQVSSEEEARGFLKIGADLLPRPSNTSRITDEDYVYGLVGIGEAHPSLRSAAVDQLIQALLADQQMASLALGHGADLLRNETERVADAIDETAAQSNPFAGLALIVAEADTTKVVPLARQRLAAAVAPRIHQPGVITFGTGLGQTAQLVTVLPDEERIRFARSLVELANDPEETAPNRYEALIALHDIAPRVPNSVRDELFEHVLPFAQGGNEPAPDGSFPASADPLSRFRISFGEFPLAPAGLMGIAALAHSVAQYTAVERIAVGQLRGANDRTAHAIALALASLPAEELTLPIDLLAGHPNKSLRALAAVVWAKRSDQPAEIGIALARDPSTMVRGALAGSLRSEASHAEVRSILSADPRRSVRRQVEADSKKAASLR